MRSAAALLPLLLLVACPEPTPTSTGGPMGGGPGPAGGPPPEGGAGGPPAGGGPPDWSSVEGDTVTLSGTLAYGGSQKGTVRLDFLGAGDINGLQHSMSLTEPGPWSVKAPKSAGSVYVVAFLDLASDGPSATDPAGRTADPVVIGAEDVAAIDITILDTPDLGDLTPGAPMGGGGPPPGAGPEGGGVGAAGGDPAATVPGAPGEGAPAPAGGAPGAPGEGAPPAGGAPAPVEGAPPAGGAPAEGAAGQ